MTNNPIHLSEELVRRIETIKKIAEQGDEGDVSFIEISSYPLVSLLIISGERYSENETKRKIHLEYKTQPSCFPTYNISSVGPEKIGYDKYMLDNVEDKKKMTLDEYSNKFNIVCSNIDKAIRKYHGIKCYEDGNEGNTSTANVFILHVCDVMNILHCKRNGGMPTLFLKTRLLKEICSNAIFEFLSTYFNENSTKFLFNNIDYFYLCYAYFGNYSFVPIRCMVDDESTSFKESKFFTNNPEFVYHQMGKMKAFNQTNEKTISKFVYRSI